MDGYDLTITIRRTEQQKRLQPTPIVALTANALKGEEDHCLEIGMNAYLSKPIELKRMKKTLMEYLPALKSTQSDQNKELDDNSSTNQRQSEADEATVDLTALNAVLGEDPTLHRLFLKSFIPQSEGIVQEIHDAYSAGELKQIGALGHKLKSSARTIGANALADLCNELEKSGKAEEQEAVDRLLPSLTPKFEAVREFIDNLVTAI